MNFTHLHVHTEYSLLDGSNKIKEYVARVKELGMDSAAITDHGVMYGVIDFYKEAKAAGLDVVTKKYIMSANGKSVLSDQERGFIKVVADAESKKLLGAQMMCARATDMIGELAVAVGNGLTLDDVANIIHPHPTFVEGINEAVR